MSDTVYESNASMHFFFKCDISCIFKDYKKKLRTQLTVDKPSQ